jgi:DNA-binding LacI/PurR family transcriptional regulator
VDAADSTELVGQRAMRQLLARGPRIDAVFAASDLMAIGAIHALDEAGLKVPRDVAVVGFDDIPMAQFAKPPLTTVRRTPSAPANAWSRSDVASRRKPCRIRRCAP